MVLTPPPRTLTRGGAAGVGITARTAAYRLPTRRRLKLGRLRLGPQRLLQHAHRRPAIALAPPTSIYFATTLMRYPAPPHTLRSHHHDGALLPWTHSDSRLLFTLFLSITDTVSSPTTRRPMTHVTSSRTITTLAAALVTLLALPGASNASFSICERCVQSEKCSSPEFAQAACEYYCGDTEVTDCHANDTECTPDFDDRDDLLICEI